MGDNEMAMKTKEVPESPHHLSLTMFGAENFLKEPKNIPIILIFKMAAIQKVANVARETFKTILIDKTLITDKLNILKCLCNEIKAADLNITLSTQEALSSNSARPSYSRPPVSYMEIYEDKVLTMGIFLLRKGSRIPLHDHPGMYGFCRVLYGTISVESFSHIDKDISELNVPEFEEFQDKPGPDMRFLTPTKHNQSGEFSSNTGTCVLLPRIGNYHELKAVDGPAAFLDILAPPYEPERGRDCLYYKLLSEKTGDTKWLLQIDPPRDFWCDNLPYPGPEVTFAEAQ
ncbi:2-aminoethanethiol dioxygenase-like [Anneissia japonica]|uniref:2-aminoethanethiol dioxygenase-like n=1 Tax=Anneissia japonica TaxID=1529436 RepID=UPI0014259D77|nr:2-aminoethanethiol dioxygenase-like [Anneissia japonica]